MCTTSKNQHDPLTVAVIFSPCWVHVMVHSNHQAKVPEKNVTLYTFRPVTCKGLVSRQQQWWSFLQLTLDLSHCLLTNQTLNKYCWLRRISSLADNVCQHCRLLRWHIHIALTMCSEWRVCRSTIYQLQFFVTDTVGWLHSCRCTITGCQCHTISHFFLKCHKLFHWPHLPPVSIPLTTQIIIIGMVIGQWPFGPRHLSSQLTCSYCSGCNV